MFEIIKKEYEIDLLGQTLKFEQATLYECIEFSYNMQKEDFNIYDWIIDFLQDKIQIKKTSVFDYNKFMQVMYDYRFKGFFAKGKSGGKTIPYESYIVFLAEKLNTDPNTLIKNYTPEQLAYYLDGVVYNINEQSKEGKMKNKISQAFKEMANANTVEDDLAELKAMEERRKKKNLINNN